MTTDLSVHCHGAQWWSAPSWHQVSPYTRWPAPPQCLHLAGRDRAGRSPLLPRSAWGCLQGCPRSLRVSLQLMDKKGRRINASAECPKNKTGVEERRYYSWHQSLQGSCSWLLKLWVSATEFNTAALLLWADSDLWPATWTCTNRQLRQLEEEEQLRKASRLLVWLICWLKKRVAIPFTFKVQP